MQRVSIYENKYVEMNEMNVHEAARTQSTYWKKKVDAYLNPLPVSPLT